MIKIPFVTSCLTRQYNIIQPTVIEDELSMIVSSCQIIVFYSFLRLICRFYIIHSSLYLMFDILLIFLRIDSFLHSILPPFVRWLIFVFFFIISLLPLPFIRWLIFVFFFLFLVIIPSIFPPSSILSMIDIWYILRLN